MKLTGYTLGEMGDTDMHWWHYLAARAGAYYQGRDLRIQSRKDQQQQQP